MYLDLMEIGVFKSRRERDSNPRKVALQRFSRPPQSTALPSLRKEREFFAVNMVHYSNLTPFLSISFSLQTKISQFGRL